MTDPAAYQTAAAKALDEASVANGRATMYALADCARDEHPTAKVVVLSESDQGDWLWVDWVEVEGSDEQEPLDDDGGYASSLYTDVWILRELYNTYDVRGLMDYGKRSGVRSFRMDVEKVLAECAPPEARGQDYAQVVVNISRSAGDDRAILVTIDTPGFEPDASDGGPGLRVALNDDTVFEGKAYEPIEDGTMHEAEGRGIVVDLDEIPYTGKELD